MKSNLGLLSFHMHWKSAAVALSIARVLCLLLLTPLYPPPHHPRLPDPAVPSLIPCIFQILYVWCSFNTISAFWVSLKRLFCKDMAVTFDGAVGEAVIRGG